MTSTGEGSPLLDQEQGNHSYSGSLIPSARDTADSFPVKKEEESSDAFLSLLQISATSMLESVVKFSTIVWEHVGQIGLLGSMSIAVNFLTGPAMLEIPAVFQKSGVIPTCLTIVVVCVLSTLGSLYMARAISQVPGNDSFQLQVEYSEVFRRHFQSSPGRTSQYWFVGTHVVFFACVTCLNVSSLVDSAQVFDTILANAMGGTHALQITTLLPRDGWHWVGWNYTTACSQEDLLRGDCIPFGQTGYGDDDGVILTAGYLLNILCFLPLAMMNLQENAAWQVVEFLVLIITSGIFVCLFWIHGIEWEGRLSWWGESWDGLMGVILFNFALVISIASWLYEKEPQVDARQVIVGSSISAALLYMFVGILGAMSMPHVSENMLQTFMSGVLGPSMQVTASIFALFIVGLGIPLLSVLCRLNLTGSGMSQSTGNLLAVYFSFGISWLLYRGDLVMQLLSWGGVIFTSLVAFIFPLVLALQANTNTNTNTADDSRSILVYGTKQASSKQFERCSLYLVLVVSVVSITTALVGNVLQ